MRDTIGSAKVSVVIPAFGRCPYLSLTLQALRKQTIAPLEIIIVHSGETELIPESLQLAKSHVLIRHRPRLFAGDARNLGAFEAKGSLLAFVDSDVVPQERWLESLVAAHHLAPNDVIVGAIGCFQEGRYWGMSLWFSEFSGAAPFLPSRRVRGKGASCNMLVSADIFHRCSGFPREYRMGQDTLLFFRLEQLGHPSYFCSSAIVDHVNLPGFRNCIQHSFVLGKWSAVNRKTAIVSGKILIQVPIAIPFAWMWRLGMMVLRTARFGGSAFRRFVFHFPGITVSLLAWNAGFIRGLWEPIPRSVDGWLGKYGNVNFSQAVEKL